MAQNSDLDGLKIRYLVNYPPQPSGVDPLTGKVGVVSGYRVEHYAYEVVMHSASVARDRVAQGFAEFA